MSPLESISMCEWWYKVVEETYDLAGTACEDCGCHDDGMLCGCGKLLREENEYRYVNGGCLLVLQR
jgi:hypothetical protein